MEKERQNFVYGNEEEGVPGCIKNGISEEIANHIYDEMTDFAKYAFNNKWTQEMMRISVIPLPVNDDDSPDFQFMEDYIKSLPYGSHIS